MANYKKVSERIEELRIDNPKTAHSLRWLYVSGAGKNEISYLHKRYNFDLAHVRAAAASVAFQRPEIFNGNNYLCLILHFPALKDGRIIAAEVDFFIGHGFLVMVNNNGLKVLSDFFSLGKKSPDSLLAYRLESSAILLYEILERLMESCYRLLDENSLSINQVEELIFSGQEKEAVERILNLRRNIINIRRIMQNHKNILQKLMEMKSSLVGKGEMKKYYNSLVDHSKRIWETLENQKEMVEALNNTNASILDNKMTDVMRTLTIFSVIIFPLTLLATIFSMRTEDTPLINHPHGFWLIIVSMLLCSLVMIIFFKRKKWM